MVGGPVARDQILDDRDRAGQGGHDREPRGDGHGHLHPGLADADDGAGGDLARGVQAGVVEAGDDVSMRTTSLCLGDQGQHGGDGAGLIGVSFDAGGGRGRVACHDPRAGRGTGNRGLM